MKINEILADISIATIVLTRLPINNIFSINQNIEIHRGQWAYPIVGASIGFLLFLLICLFEGLVIVNIGADFLVDRYIINGCSAWNGCRFL